MTVPRRFHGPRRSGNGGWCAGTLSTFLPGAHAVTVRLSAPPPLERALQVEVSGDVEARGDVEVKSDTEPARAVARDGDAVVLTATCVSLSVASALHVVEPVPPDRARAAESSFRGLVEHPFPSCFSCGPERAEGDGLRLSPGVLPGAHDRTACTWAPGMDVDLAQTWAALDCPGGWSVDLVGRPMVLGSLTAAVSRVPGAGEVCVVMGQDLGTTGRRTQTAATLWSYGDGTGAPERLGTAEHVWIAVDPATFGLA